jgi:hypothetical protein
MTYRKIPRPAVGAPPLLQMDGRQDQRRREEEACIEGRAGHQSTRVRPTLIGGAGLYSKASCKVPLGRVVSPSQTVAKLESSRVPGSNIAIL